MSSGWGSLLSGELWEFVVYLQVLHGSSSGDARVWLNDSLDDVDGVTLSAVSTSHFTVHLGDGAAESNISVFLVHVDDTSSGKILKDDTVVFDGIGLSLEDLADGNDFTLALSNLVLSLHLVPEVRSSNDCVLGENPDSVAGWIGVRLAWKLSTGNPILFDLQFTKISQPIREIRFDNVYLRLFAWRELLHL